MPKRLKHRDFAPACFMLLAAGAPAPSLAPVPPPIAQSRTDCARPQYASDTLVCGDAGLTAIDAEVAALAALLPPLADGAIWEDQAAWQRRRSRCAFDPDHRSCLIAAYTDRRSVLAAAGAPATQPVACSGAWRGRNLAVSEIVPGQPVAIREDGRLLGVATPHRARWRPMLAWRAATSGIRLTALDGRQLSCRPARR